MGKGGHWDLFEKAANASLIPWNGSETLKFIPGQPQRKISCEPELFSACTVPLISGMGAFYMSRCIGIAVFSKRSQRPPNPPFQSAKFIQKNVKQEVCQAGIGKYLSDSS